MKSNMDLSKSIKKVAMIAALITVTGCSSTGGFRLTPAPEKLYGDVYAAKCDGMAIGWGPCYKDAAQVCKGDFMVMERDENQGAGTLFATQYGLHTLRGVHRELIFKCAEKV